MVFDFLVKERVASDVDRSDESLNNVKRDSFEVRSVHILEADFFKSPKQMLERLICYLCYIVDHFETSHSEIAHGNLRHPRQEKQKILRVPLLSVQEKNAILKEFIHLLPLK